ncbi:hypothetical protein B0I37DRAFT_237109 [Chaetomium sp. MPI-CAGE-AT-0009]|nr:hypothetical protein B0I37DRAFT_237109 [Chaetomium sp. MPI-CAGE-AT-0009]
MPVLEASPSPDSPDSPDSPPLPSPRPQMPPDTIRAQPPTSVTRPSPYLEKLASMPENYVFRMPEPPPYTYEPIYYFFYGTLTNPNILKEVLGLETDPVLRTAKIIGYDVTNWGQYKALIDGEPGAVVTGCAYMVQSVDEELRLAHYETNAYKLAPCEISFTDDADKEEDGEPVIGHTFKYAGSEQSSTQGGFDPTLWEMYMGTRLPPGWQMGTVPEVGQKTAQRKEGG